MICFHNQTVFCFFFAFCCQCITKNRKHWSTQTLDDNVLMVRSIHGHRINSLVTKVGGFIKIYI